VTTELCVRRAERFIAAHVDEPLDVTSIARDCGVSARSLYRAFQQCRSYTPRRFLKLQRLERARLMLQNATSRPSVTQVGFACGFSDLSYFSREYARAFGVPPSLHSIP
jgi:transcriptional regulator GlxA family with amidase domain